MLINGIDLSSLGIKLYDRVLESNQVDTTQAWLDGDIKPTHIRQQDRFKNVQLSFLVLGNDEEDAFLRISRLTQMLRKATIQFDDLKLLFDVALTGAAEPERLKNGNFIVKYNLTSDYAKGEREIYTTDANLTNSFKLNVLYYQNSTTLITSESITVRASAFDGDNDTLKKAGIDVDKYLPQYYNHGIATNLNGLEITYENLLNLGTLIINYTPIDYKITVKYFLDDGKNYYNQILEEMITFNYPQLKNIQTIGQLIKPQTYKPEGHIAKISYDGDITIDDLLTASPISVFYDKIESEKSKNIIVRYYNETDNEDYELIDTNIIYVKESNFYDGIILSDLINVNAMRPNPLYYNEGHIEDHALNELITYETTETEYAVRYSRHTNTIFVEYYAGTYPGWYRLTTATLTTKYKDAYENNFSLEAIGIDVDRYHTAEYEKGAIYNKDTYDTYESVLTAGVIQVFYRPIDFTITVRYDVNGEITEEEITINALDFFNDPILADIIPINDKRPEGYQLDVENTYSGPITLANLTQASPITIAYEEIEAVRTKNIILKYKQELATAYATINTSLITISEADCVGGVRLKDIFNLNAYKPDYYENGVINGYSSTSLLSFDDIESNYEILYVASYYSTPIRYYIDEVNELNWVGSSSITYRVIDFATDTTLFTLGLDPNAFKPAYCDDGVIQYNGPINFVALRELESINIVYPKVEEPEDPEGIDYPHRFLFLQHNDLGDFESYHPEWTMNHAYINTGITADDMSKLTVIMECGRVDENVPLHEVNAGYAYLFGSTSSLGSFYMRFNNQTQYGTNLSGVNTYEAKAGYYTNPLTLTEESAIGFSENTGIYSSERQGYSYATFTYTNQVQTENAQMPYPLYLFANNNAGSYQGGLAGIGIYGCRIYYDNVLVRDMIPVQFYDKIGDQIAPSNCLYDKITQTFFEDGTGQNSFNIIDDDRFIDTNLEHKIGSCYVNYYKGNELIKTSIIWFRASDFVDKEWDPYTNFFVDQNQPAYYKPGVIENYDNLIFDFDNLNNNTYNVIYEEQNNKIFVNYYRETDGVKTLLAEEVIPISEKDFYQVPTFGDIVRLNKYKPEGYKTDFVYTGKKVSLSRVLDGSPYEIVYVPETEPLETYTTIIRYIKKVFGIRKYELIGTKELTFDQTDFRDGEYIDFYIDKNLMKPAKYYVDGQTYEWYEMDERLMTPEDLKDVYTIWYNTDINYIDVNYYTDEINEANLVASTTWPIRLDEFEGQFYLVDQLPNEYINKYKPANCGGGLLENPEKLWTFEELANVGEISIVYESLLEPDDPENASYEQKILYWGHLDDDLHLSDEYAGKIPYIDLGYRPKEIGRLRLEMTCYAQSSGFKTKTTPYGFQDEGYTYFFGYYGTKNLNMLGRKGANIMGIINNPGSAMTKDTNSGISPGSKGCFAVRCRLPLAHGWTYEAYGPQFIDGQVWYSANSNPGVITGQPKMIAQGIEAQFRRGAYAATDDDYNEFVCFKNYGLESNFYIEETGHPRETDGFMQSKLALGVNRAFANPFTITMDAYNNYFSVYNWDNSNTPFTSTPENTDIDIFEYREQPRGSLSLFLTTNPTTGEVNLYPENLYTTPALGSNVNNMILENALTSWNPYDPSSGQASVEIKYLVIVDFTSSNKVPIYEEKVYNKNINFANFPVPVNPTPSGCAVWRIKLYDRDRLVRDLIPVAKGDKIYDYIMPENGLFDLITEIFFGNSNHGGEYEYENFRFDEEGKLSLSKKKTTIKPEDIMPLYCIPDPLSYGKITTNYYNHNNQFIANQFVDVPTWFCGANTTIEDILQYNDYKPDDFHLDGMLDLDADLSFQDLSLAELYEMGTANVYYKLRTFTKSVVYYRDNVRVASKDLFFSLQDIENAKTIADLGIDVDLYYDKNFAHGRVVFNENIIAEDDIRAFIDAPSPIVVYDKLTKEEAPNLLYLEYYRGGAYEDGLITIDGENPNYLNCNLDGVVLNPNGAIKYYNHYHSALYEDEEFDYFIPYQVRVLDKYTGIHSGPARKYKTLAMIIDQDIYTIIEERNGWGRLKEYSPTGWILLNATEPMTGPGQNPDYDPVDAEVATIPFASRVHITKLTIDRLWCYVPELESWVKAEDISYDQAGKLYNGLDIKVINLDDIDFSTVQSLTDMGIYPEAKKLRFHDYTNYTYEGEYTYEAFSNLHEIDFVYPETIYTYTCIYYKDHMADANELGRSGFSCSISDWNPDWDIFIATSWQTDEEGNEINPTLYRDTELTLNWTYFGFERDLYRPEGYGKGIYLWNPRTWDRNNITFTFNELIRCGTQYVVYPIFEPDTYKLYVRGNYVGQYYDVSYTQGTTRYYKYNPGISFNLAVDEDKYIDLRDVVVEDSGYPNISADYDIYTEGEMITPEENVEKVVVGRSAELWGNGVIEPYYNKEIYRPSIRFLNNNRNGGYTGFRDTSDSSAGIYPELAAITPGSSVALNVSTIRETPTVIMGYANIYNDQPYKYFVVDKHTKDADGNYQSFIPLTDSLNLNNKDYKDLYTGTEEYSKYAYWYLQSRDIMKDNFGTLGTGADYNNRQKGMLYSTISYKNFIMKHYWVPVPKGLWYVYDGEERRMEDNGMFDLLTGEFARSYRAVDGKFKYTGTDGYTKYDMSGTPIDGEDIVFLRKAQFDLSKAYNYFTDWQFNANECNYLVQLTTGATTYKHPDIYATKIRDINNGLVLPITKYTSDAANKVVGEWYYSCGQWFESKNATIYAGDFDATRLEERYHQFVLVPDADQTMTFYVYLDPENVATVGETSDYSYGKAPAVLTSYYNYTDAEGNIYFFDGSHWVPQAYTDYNRIESNKTYAVAKDTPYYSVPIAADEYKITNYLYGERLTILYTCANNPNWGYTGQGWIEIEGNLSEVV